MEGLILLLTIFAPLLVARLLVVGMLLREAEDASVVALALEATESCFERLVGADLNANHESWMGREGTVASPGCRYGVEKPVHVCCGGFPRGAQGGSRIAKQDRRTMPLLITAE